MAKDKMKILLSASVLGMLGVSLLVGGTYALFSGSANAKTHLKAGNLNVSLVRTHYSKTVLNAKGYLETEEKDEIVDFTNDTDKNIFGLNDEEVIVPTSKFSADLKISNNGSVAFDYTVKLDTDITNSGSNLINQLEVKVVKGDYTITKKLSECTNSTIFSGVMATSDKACEFTVSLEFLNLNTNNSAKEEKASFDLTVEATQKTKE